MNKKIIKVALILSAMVSSSSAGCRSAGCSSARLELQGQKEVKPDPVEKVLKQLREKTAELKSYQCLVEYEVNQPTFESKTLRKGILYYKKAGNDSALRISFRTFRQDDEKEEKYIDQYIINGHWLTKINYEFDGVWLTHIDHQLKSVECHQLAEPNDPNEPVDAFELISRNFPIVGFTKVEDLRKEFEIKLVEQEKNKAEKFIQLHLKVKPDSVYKDDYTTIDFWIDKKLGLPARIVGVATTEDAKLKGDILQLRFIKPRINKKIDKKVFGIKIPKGFGKPEIFPLKKAEKNKDTRPRTND